jgi:hypothetical protein
MLSLLVNNEFEVTIADGVLDNPLEEVVMKLPVVVMLGVLLRVVSVPPGVKPITDKGHTSE